MSETARQIRYKYNKGIGNWKGIGPGYLRGYMGLSATALAISEYIPKCVTYVEPFAGLGRVARHVTADSMILNDKSQYAYDFLVKHFECTITSTDFEETLRSYDSENTVFLIDPPWSRKEYTMGCNGNAFCDRRPTQYYNTILEWLPKLKGRWFVCGKKDNTKMQNSRYHTKLFTSRKKIMGGAISTLVMSNEPFTRYHQHSLDYFT